LDWITYVFPYFCLVGSFFDGQNELGVAIIGDFQTATWDTGTAFLPRKAIPGPPLGAQSPQSTFSAAAIVLNR
jgi:hypothetical protein